MAQPLTSGEVEELMERWMQYAADDEDWLIVRALTELHRIREQQDETRIAQAERDLAAMRASCDDDVESCFVGVAG